MDDRLFWEDLEYRISADLQASTNASRRRYWVDGFIPERGENTQAGIMVHGKAWVAEGSRKQTAWTFRAEVPQRMLAQRSQHYDYALATFDPEQQLLLLSLSIPVTPTSALPSIDVT